jgi:LuxR family maltose regulon positive regulatory protein
MGGGMNPYYLATGWLATFRLAQIQWRLEDALTCLDQLDLLWPDIGFFTQGLRLQAKMRLQPDDETVQAARSWLSSYPDSFDGALPLPGTGPIGEAEFYYQANLIWARLQIALGNPQEVWPYLTRQLELARESRLTGRVIELILLEAQAHQKVGQTQKALDLLEQAFSVGQPEQFIRTFDQSSLLDVLIHTAVNQGMCPAYGKRILTAIRIVRDKGWLSEIGSTSENIPETLGLFSDERLIEPLSVRELDILRLMAIGATNKAIAEQLVITVGTVKSHINHIFNKLEAHNRTEAVAQARRRGLLG